VRVSEKLAPSSLRQDVSELVKHLSFRFFQAPLREKERLAFESYGKAKKGVRFTDAEVAELIHLMMSTPIYQLG